MNRTPRPNIGWLCYLVLAQSPRRLVLVLAVSLVAAVHFVLEAKHTLTLEYQQPHPYPPPVIVLAHADTGHLTAMDACGVESATRAVDSPSVMDVKSYSRQWPDNNPEIPKLLKEMRNPMKEWEKSKKLKGNNNDRIDEVAEYKHKESKKIQEEHQEYIRKANKIQERIRELKMRSELSDDRGSPDKVKRVDLEMDLDSGQSILKWSPNKLLKRTVLLYLWRSTVFKGDKWTHFVSELRGVHISKMDASKSLQETPLRSWQYMAGLTSQPTWLSYLTGVVGLLWSTGGFVIPLGVILTKPVAVVPLGDGVGILAAAPGLEGALTDLVIGTPPKHEILAELLNIVVNGSTYLKQSPSDGWSPVLTSAVEEGCGTSHLPYLYISDCDDFTMIPGDQVVQTQQVISGPEGTLFQYTGPSADLWEPSTLRFLFEHLKLERYCPLVAEEVMAGGRMSGL